MQKRVHIIPLVKVKNDLDYFSYAVPEELSGQIAPGQLVEINFRNRVIEGLVYSFIPENEVITYTLKPIDRIVDPNPMLDEWQLKLIKRLSLHFLVSMTMVARSILPSIPKRKHEIERYMDTVTFTTAPEELFANLLSDKMLVKYRRDRTRDAFLIDQISKIESDEQIAIIFPEILEVESFARLLGEYKDATAVYLAQMNKTQAWDNWQRVSSGSAKIILGARNAIFAPFKQIKKIILVDESHDSHKQEEPNPRYTTQFVAGSIHDAKGADIVYLSRSPSLSSLHKVATEEFDYKELDGELEPPFVTMVDMNKEPLSGNTGTISNTLDEHISYAIKAGQKTFLLLDKKGTFTNLICSDCDAEVPTERLEQAGYAGCPNCGSARLRPVGLGITAVKELLEKKYQCRVFSFSADDEYDGQTIQEYVEHADIVLGTSYAWAHVSQGDFSIIGTLSADLLLHLEDFSFAEQTFSRLYEIASSLSKDQRLIVQTRSFDHPLFNAIYNFDLKPFYLYEISQRKQYGYPPYATLVKLIYKNPNERAGEKEVIRGYERIDAQMPPDTSLLPPFQAHPFRVRDQYHWHMAIKAPQGYDMSLLSFLRSENIVIDVDPLTLI